MAALHDEDVLVRYALDATAPQVEERCRQIRNVQPESVHDARRAWDARSLSAWRNVARGTLCLRVELPIEVGELVMQAIERALEQEEVADGVAESSPSGFQSQQADALVGDREDVSRWRCDASRARARPRRPIATKSSCTSTKQPSVEGLVGRMRRSRR